MEFFQTNQQAKSQETKDEPTHNSENDTKLKTDKEKELRKKYQTLKEEHEKKSKELEKAQQQIEESKYKAVHSYSL